MDKEIRIPISALLLLAAGIVIGIAVMLLVPRTEPTTTEKPAEVAATAESAQTAARPDLAPAPPVSSVDMPPPVNTSHLVPPPVGTNASVAGRHMEYSESTSGYPIAVGRRAVDSTPEGFVTSGNAVLLDESGAIMDPEPRPIGRNGLVGNPSVDPPSSRGAAYGRAYDWQ
jgi:hypothetical protein